MSNKFAQRFEELQGQMAEIFSAKTMEYHEYYQRQIPQVSKPAVLEWRIKVRNLLGKVAGDTSEHYQAFVKSEAIGSFGTAFESVERSKAVFNAAKEDFEGGYMQSARALVQAEVFDSELDQSRELLSSGYRTPAAVIARVVLETAMRELCAAANITPSKLDKMNADLVKAGTYNVLVQKRVTAFAHVGNSAAHGKPDEFTDADVKDMIEGVERFLADHLSS